MANWREQIGDFWGRLPPGRRAVLGAAAAISAAVLGAVAWWGWSDDSVDAWTSRDPGELREVAATLDEQGIPYSFSSDGTAIRVSPADEGRARIAGAAIGKGTGYEALEKIELGTSPQRERWAYQRALQGELARTIGSLKEVEWARVHLVLPERTVFLRDEAHASASVTVRLRQGASLSAPQVRGITALVAGAVDGLRPAEVVLVDDEGRLISGGVAEDEALATLPTLMSARATEERRTRAAIQEALTRVLGSPGHVAVGVTVDLDTRSVDRTTRSQDPDTQVVVSESIREESTTNSSPGGVPGTASNLPEEAPGPATARASTQDLMEQRSNYAYTQVEERAVEGAGSIRRVSVGVVVNADRIAALTETLAGRAADPPPKKEEIQERLEKRIEETVRVAMGYDEARGDKLVVAFLPFTTADEAATSSEEDGWARAAAVAPYAIGLVGMLAFILFVARPIAAAAAGRRPAGGEAAIAGALEETPPAGPLTLAERLREMVDNFKPVQARELNQLVGQEREITAQVLRRWIRET